MRWLPTAVIFVLGAVVAVGCGGGGGGGGTTPPPTSNTLIGQVVDAYTPTTGVAGATVTVTTSTGPVSATTASDGTFSVPSLPLETVAMQVSKPGYYASPQVQIAILVQPRPQDAGTITLTPSGPPPPPF